VQVGCSALRRYKAAVKKISLEKQVLFLMKYEKTVKELLKNENGGVIIYDRITMRVYACGRIYLREISRCRRAVAE